MSDIIGKVIKPTTEFLEELARKLPEALGKGHYRVGQHIHTAADEFDKAEDDLTNAAKHHPHDDGRGHHDLADVAGTGATAAGGARAVGDANRQARTGAEADTDHHDLSGEPNPADMGTRRAQRARTADDSHVAVPPAHAPDGELSSGDPVYYRDGSTAIGYDNATQINFDSVGREADYHDVVVHGNSRGYFEPGRVNAAGHGFPAADTHPTHIAEAVRNNPSYDGGPVRLVSCHTGTSTPDSGEVPAAQSVANHLGVPVKAPTNKVGVSRLGGPEQTPEIFGGGYWRTFLPIHGGGH